MQTPPPTPTPGRELREKREGYGITRKALAEKLAAHRNTVLDWENDPALDPMRTARYDRALRELIAEGIA